ncbi:MAG TPA: c-type cytochrome [Pyrinomonadaceae bacterium]|nr:c-type cytochrome [Pyrinomonadaceae bacterium]
MTLQRIKLSVLIAALALSLGFFAVNMKIRSASARTENVHSDAFSFETALAARQQSTQQQADPPVEQVAKNIKVLNGLPSSQLIPVMNFMGASLGVRCDYCHVRGQDGRLQADSDAKPAKQTARGMIQMVLNINRTNAAALQGATVTCYTCHRGQTAPQNIPTLPLTTATRGTGGTAPTPPGAAPASLPTAEQILEKYVTAVGGRAAIAKIQTTVMKGSTEMAPGRTGAVEITLKSSNSMLMTTTGPQGAVFARAITPSGGWMRNPRGARALHGADLDDLRLETLAFSALKISEPFPRMTVVGRDRVGDHDAYVLEYNPSSDTRQLLYFDSETGFLLRQLFITKTMLAPIPEQLDYSDYRNVDGVMLPFLLRFSSVDESSAITLTEIKHNVPVDDSIFRMPEPSPPAATPSPSPSRP